MDAQTAIDDAWESIGEFCCEECKAYCCRKGYLVLSRAQARLIVGDVGPHLESIGALKRLDGDRFSLFMGRSDAPCPGLNQADFRCRVHDDPDRPSTCRDFPIFIIGKTVRFSHRCLAVRQGKFYALEKELIALGYSLVEYDPGTAT